MHRERLLSVVILLPLFLLLVIYGGKGAFAVLGAAVAAIGLWEFSRMVEGRLGAEGVLVVFGGVGLVGLTYFKGVAWLSLGIIFFLMLLLGIALSQKGEMVERIRKTSSHLLGILYIGGTLSLAVALRKMSGGEGYILLACGIVWAGDTIAFYTGITLGRHPLAPSISPKKTVEGSIGGLCASILSAPLFARALGIAAPLPMALFLGAVVGGVGQVGDLAESMIKRAFQVKDTGNLLPGHGGVLDRIDSLLFALPTLYLWVRFGWI
jgi:phosphatidate cytidylyltransferase